MASTFIDIVSDTISREGLLSHDGGPVLVAVSGGADSVALLSVLTELGYACEALHCNFGLRGEESERDMHHAEQVAQALHCPLRVKRFDVEARCRATGESVEMACRELRYAWFDEERRRRGAQVIAVGHHRDDNIETFMLNLLRGSGLAGLAAMSYRNDRCVVRPLLDVTRAMITDYLSERGLTYVTDSTNADNEYRRNRIRNRVLPLINELFPQAQDTMTASLRHMADNLRLYRKGIAALTASAIGGDGAIDVRRLIADHGIGDATLLLFELLKDRGINITQATDIVASAAAGRSGRRLDTGAATMMLSYGVLRAVSRDDDATDAVTISLDGSTDITTPVAISVSTEPIAAFDANGLNDNTLVLDPAALAGNPTWQLRHPRRGDKMRPYGMRQPRLLSEIFKKRHIAADKRASVWLLTRNDVIIWAIGVRTSAEFNIKNNKNNQLFIKLQAK
ncbi:MAG: tRNA lysidine(34) synthetase TilS [Muribaculaceae bacterium]